MSYVDNFCQHMACLSSDQIEAYLAGCHADHQDNAITQNTGRDISSVEAMINKNYGPEIKEVLDLDDFESFTNLNRIIFNSGAFRQFIKEMNEVPSYQSIQQGDLAANIPAFPFLIDFYGEDPILLTTDEVEKVLMFK